MKVVSVVGARPQFIKAAAVSRVLRTNHREVLVHTGQHYDEALSDVFFTDLDMPAPDYNLGVGSASHARQTAAMLERLEEVLLAERPDWVLVYGDTNSTLAGALAAAQAGLPLAHVEAGLRSHNRSMPEELNRVLADRCADLLLCPTDTAVRNLAREGVCEGVHQVGDVMYDSLLRWLSHGERDAPILDKLGLSAGGYLLATVHRPANTDDVRNLSSILEALRDLAEPVVFPAHPRTQKALAAAAIAVPPNVRIVEPFGYQDMLVLEKHARCVVTDSGGVQKEAYLLGVSCVTLREETEWPETLSGGWNALAGADTSRIVEAARRPAPQEPPAPCFGDGRAAEKIVRILEDDPSQRRGVA